MLIFICDDSKADQLRLARNINNYAMELHASVTVQVFDSADSMLKDYKSRKDKPDIIFLDIYMDGTNGMDAAQFNRTETRIFLSSIYYAESSGHSTMFVTENGIVRSSAPISSYLPDFDSSPEFLVCGRSYIINLDAAESFEQDSGEMRFPDGSLVVVPVRLRREIRMQLRGKEL